MIYNKHLDRLMEVPIVQDFMALHKMQGALCSEGENHSFILYRFPYVVEFHDALIENYLEITLSDLLCDLLICGSVILGYSLEMSYQTLTALRARNFSDDPLNELFLSDGIEKMRYLHSHLEAIDKLLPQIESKGGLSSIQDGTFDSRFDFATSVQPMYPGLKGKYLKCIDELT